MCRATGSLTRKSCRLMFSCFLSIGSDLKLKMSDLLSIFSHRFYRCVIFSRTNGVVQVYIVLCKNQMILECYNPITNNSEITKQQKWNDYIICTKTSPLATKARLSISTATTTTNFQLLDLYYSFVSAVSVIFRGFVSFYRI